MAGAGVGLALAGRLAAARQTNGIASKGIGLTRTRWDDLYGPGEATQSLGKYTDPTYGGPIFVGLDFVAFDDGLVDFIEVQWANLNQIGGLRQDAGDAAVRPPLPDDARLRETFTMPATPGGPISLRAQRWTSASLGDVTGGRASILVVFQEKTGQLNPGTPMEIIATAATIAVEQA